MNASSESYKIKQCRLTSKLPPKLPSADSIKKKVKVLYPVQDEDSSTCSFDVNCYK